jgi:hypothetical protein
MGEAGKGGSNMIKPWAAPLMLALLAGCAAEPFERPPLPLLNNANPQAMRYSFARSVMDRFTSDDTVIIHAPFRNDLAILGVLQVDRPAGTFELVGLNQLGIELFHVGGDRHGEAIRSAVPPLMKQKTVLLSIAQDMRRMYFELTPERGAKIDIGSRTVEFSEKTAQGELVFEFGGEPAVLLEKHLDGWFGTIWRVRYFLYASSSGSLYPRGVVMDNGRYHYRIIMKNRAIE